MNSNSAFKEILENNKEFIDTLNNIVKDIKIKREDYINLENRITGRSFERDENNKRDFNTFIYFDLEKELKLKKYKDFFPLSLLNIEYFFYDSFFLICFFKRYSIYS